MTTPKTNRHLSRADPDPGKQLRNARILDDAEVSTEMVTLGSTVVLKDLELGDTWHRDSWLYGSGPQEQEDSMSRL